MGPPVPVPDAEQVLSPEENRALLEQWAKTGEQGPISDETASGE